MREMTYFPLLERYPVTSAFGYRVDPITGAPSKFHNGIDYGAPWGAPVIAPFDGQVTTGYESGAGNWSWVCNGPDMFKSFHHDMAEVHSGWVSAGTVIAYINSTGSSTGSHAHMELWEHGAVIDPTGYFERAPLWQNRDWFEMASEDDLRRIVREELANNNKKIATNSMWTDGKGQYEVTFNGHGQRIKRRIKSPDELNALKVARAIASDWVMDVTKDPRILDSFPTAPE